MYTVLDAVLEKMEFIKIKSDFLNVLLLTVNLDISAKTVGNIDVFWEHVTLKP